MSRVETPALSRREYHTQHTHKDEYRTDDVGAVYFCLVARECHDGCHDGLQVAVEGGVEGCQPLRADIEQQHWQ